ncbi:endogenous retrovirus group K member 19 Env polyprotein [Cricetulus griseus]|uniref:endogenous retrovirus group K member 19 Env polyprotein n=1 Tax=Cricetulus griseus TaxID=10029 RepID=UPI0007DAA3E7|nr:endogenous retrovirus group K member 19 Env polyprotein [Cricetulus griseus]
MYFLAFLALISAPPSIEGVAYWAYIPNPPILQPVGWLDPEPIRVLTNDTVRMGGARDSDARASSSSLITFEGRADSPPICITLQGKMPEGCLSTGSVAQVKQEVFQLQFKNKKRGTATPTAVTPV